MSHFSRAEPLKLKNLRKDDIVVKDDDIHVDGQVTKINKKTFQIDKKTTNHQPLRWSILREPPLAFQELDSIEAAYKKVMLQIAELPPLMVTSYLLREKTRIEDLYREKKKECNIIYWNAVDGKAAVDGGLDNAQISAIYQLYEPDIRMKLKAVLEIEIPRPAMGCTIT